MFCIYMNVLSKIYELIIQILSFFWNDLPCTSVFFPHLWTGRVTMITSGAVQERLKIFTKSFKNEKSQIAP